ncbi:MAG: hypothetical protein IJL03_00775 [Lachnospiraceae bacterium]|nr:hypothetical protein [Lachnospiraceae bacterium]
MNDKSKKFAFASGILFLAAFIAGLYDYVVSMLYTAKAMDTNVFKVLKMIFKNKDSLKLHMLVYALLLVLLVLFIAMFTENRAMFFISVLLATGLFAYRMYYWADYASKYMKNWKWDSMKTFTFIYSCVLVGMVLVFLLCASIALLGKSSTVGAFSTLAFIFSAFILGISIAAGILELFTDDFDSDLWSSYVSRFQANNMNSFATTLSMFLVVILLGRWATLKCEALNGVKNASVPVDQGQPQVAAAMFFQAQQPAYQNNRPIYPAQPVPAAVQPAQAAVPAAAQPVPTAGQPAQTAAPVNNQPAPAKPVTPPPANTVFANVPEAPKAAAKVEEAAAVVASVDAMKESLKSSGPSAEEIEAAYEKISNTTDLSKEVSYTVDNLSDDMAAKLARLSEEAAKEVATGKEDDLSDALERIGEKVEKKADDAAEAVEEAVEDVAEEAADVAEEATDVVEDAVEDATESIKKVEDAAEVVSDGAEAVEEAVTEAAEDVVEK